MRARLGVDMTSDLSAVGGYWDAGQRKVMHLRSFSNKMVGIVEILKACIVGVPTLKPFYLFIKLKE